MLLSIVMPSHGSNLLTYSRIAHACSAASADVEVVVRDNSGNAQKHEFLSRLKQDNCRLVVAEPCEPYRNFVEALRLAKGDFIFLISDDDQFFDRGLQSILQTVRALVSDPSVAGVVGTYLLEETKASHIVRYGGLASQDVAERVAGYVGFQGPNLIFYSTIRRQVALDCWEFIYSHPLKPSFHDQIISLIYLLSGRFADAERLIFMYDNANWETLHKAAGRDLEFYASSGMDPAFGRFHWFLCGFEGAMLILYSKFTRDYPAERKQVAAAKWFEIMFARFNGDRRTGFGSRLEAEADAVCKKWKDSFPRFRLDEALDDISGFMNLSSPESARLYREFWLGVMSAQQQPLPPSTAS